MSHHIARSNRIGLALVGLPVALAGAAALARGLGLAPRWFGPRYEPVISERVAAYAAGNAWFWPAVAVAALVVELLALRWLLLQGATGALRHLNLERDSGRGATSLSARAVAGALENDVTEGLEGHRPARVEPPGGGRARSSRGGLTRAARGERVRATLSGAPTEPHLGLVVVLPDDADPASAGQGCRRALTRLRQSLETDRLPATVRMHTIRTHF